VLKITKLVSQFQVLNPTLEQDINPEHIAKLFGSSQNMVISHIESTSIKGIPKAHIGDNFIFHQNPIVEPPFSPNCDKNQS
jgi:hypothetical protein